MTGAVAAMQHERNRRHTEVNFNRASERPLFQLVHYIKKVSLA
jgi:hypothetical protein